MSYLKDIEKFRAIMRAERYLSRRLQLSWFAEPGQAPPELAPGSRCTHRLNARLHFRLLLIAQLLLQIQVLHNNPFRPHRSRLLIISLDID